MLRRMQGRRRDEGAATPVLMMGMVLFLAMALLLLSRIAQAGDMRTRAQTGADAAALGALAPLRDAGVDLALTGMDPSVAGYWDVPGGPQPSAARYADENGTVLDGEPELSGIAGDTVKVSVKTKDCQLLEEGEQAGNAEDCTDASGEKGQGRAGTATAFATVKWPLCVPVYGEGVAYELYCDGVKVFPGGDRGTIEKLIKLRLVDKADPIAYTGLPADEDGGDYPPEAVGPGGITARTAEMRAKVIENFGAPYPVGCLRVGDPQDHGKGRACDFMTGPYGQMPTGAQEARGDAIAAWAVANAKELGIHYVIWKQRIWNIERAGEGWRPMENRGSITQNHWDHVHISVF